MIPKYDKIMYRYQSSLCIHPGLHRYLLEVDKDFDDPHIKCTTTQSRENYCMIDGKVYPCISNPTTWYDFEICQIPLKFKHIPGRTITRMPDKKLIWAVGKSNEIVPYIIAHNNVRLCIEMLEGCLITITRNYIYVSELVKEEEKMPPRINANDIWYSNFDAHFTVSTKIVPEIERVIFNYPATIVIWKDDTKTVVKCGENDQYDEETGLALCIAKKALGNKGNWYNEFKKHLPESNNAILAKITKAARKANFKKFDRDQINRVIRMIESACNSPFRFPVILNLDDAEAVKDVLKQVMASIS